jgi:hypothetical protein
MSVSAIRPTTATPHPMRRAGDFVVGRDRVADTTAGDSRTGDAATESVALTQVEPVQRAAPVSSSAGRPDASFIAHLIATAEQAPQTRELRRAAVADVEAAYRAASAYAAGSSAHRTQRTV